MNTKIRYSPILFKEKEPMGQILRELYEKLHNFFMDIISDEEKSEKIRKVIKQFYEKEKEKKYQKFKIIIEIGRNPSKYKEYLPPFFTTINKFSFSTNSLKIFEDVDKLTNRVMELISREKDTNIMSYYLTRFLEYIIFKRFIELIEGRLVVVQPIRDIDENKKELDDLTEFLVGCYMGEIPDKTIKRNSLSNSYGIIIAGIYSFIFLTEGKIEIKNLKIEGCVYNLIYPSLYAEVSLAKYNPDVLSHIEENLSYITLQPENWLIRIKWGENNPYFPVYSFLFKEVIQEYKKGAYYFLSGRKCIEKIESEIRKQLMDAIKSKNIDREVKDDLKRFIESFGIKDFITLINTILHHFYKVLGKTLVQPRYKNFVEFMNNLQRKKSPSKEKEEFLNKMKDVLVGINILRKFFDPSIFEQVPIKNEEEKAIREAADQLEKTITKYLMRVYKKVRYKSTLVKSVINGVERNIDYLQKELRIGIEDIYTLLREISELRERVSSIIEEILEDINKKVYEAALSKSAGKDEEYKKTLEDISKIVNNLENLVRDRLANYGGNYLVKYSTRDREKWANEIINYILTYKRLDSGEDIKLLENIKKILRNINYRQIIDKISRTY